MALALTDKAKFRSRRSSRISKPECLLRMGVKAEAARAVVLARVRLELGKHDKSSTWTGDGGVRCPRATSISTHPLDYVDRGAAGGFTVQSIPGQVELCVERPSRRRAGTVA